MYWLLGLRGRSNTLLHLRGGRGYVAPVRTVLKNGKKGVRMGGGVKKSQKWCNNVFERPLRPWQQTRNIISIIILLNGLENVKFASKLKLWKCLNKIYLCLIFCHIVWNGLKCYLRDHKHKTKTNLKFLS